MSSGALRSSASPRWYEAAASAPRTASAGTGAEPSSGIDERALEDVLATDPVERLTEDLRMTRPRRISGRELRVEALAAALFICVAVPLATPAIRAGSVALGIALVLVSLYALVAGVLRFPIGSGCLVPSYLIVVPMLVLLPPQAVPLLAGVGSVWAGLISWLVWRSSPARVLFAIPNAWFVVAPAIILTLTGRPSGLPATAAVYLLAFLAGSVTDLVVSSVRETLARGLPPRQQLRVVLSVWLIDACFAPLGLCIAFAARQDTMYLMTMLPVTALLVLLDRDRSSRIDQAEHRLELVARERTRLQAAVRRLGDSLAAKLDLPALTAIVLRGSIDALDAGAGSLEIQLPGRPMLAESAGSDELAPLLESASSLARRTQRPAEIEYECAHALALPFGCAGESERRAGTYAVARVGRPFRDDERELLMRLVDRADSAISEILAHESLREQALTDSLTRLGNRRKLRSDFSEWLERDAIDSSLPPVLGHQRPGREPIALVMFDLDGFKRYNDTFGHLAGDVLLARLGRRLAAAVAAVGAAYRLGGDEFCVLLGGPPSQLADAVAAAATALYEAGTTFTIMASYGSVLLPSEACTLDRALQLADERMYAQKRDRHGRTAAVRSIGIR